jgi:hypothetical protein
MSVMSPAKKKKTGTAKLRTWRVAILRNRVQFLGFVQARDRQAARSRCREAIQHQRGRAHAAGRARAGLAGGYFALPPPGARAARQPWCALTLCQPWALQGARSGAASTLCSGGPAHPIPRRRASVPPDPSSILRIRGARHTRRRARRHQRQREIFRDGSCVGYRTKGNTWCV